MVVASEPLLRLKDAVAYYPLRNGKPPHHATLHRHATVGCCGVRLETIATPYGRCTSAAAIARFFERLTAVKNGQQPTGTPTPSQRRRAHDAAERELDRLGV